MKDKFSQFAQRTRRWKFEDGSTELLLGGILLVAGIAMQMQTVVWMGVVFLPGLLLVTGLVEMLKRRYVYPRAGFVEYRETTRKGMWKPLMISTLVTAVWTATFTIMLNYNEDLALAWTTPILGFFIGMILASNALWMRLFRLVLVGLISIATGFLISPLVVPPEIMDDFFGLGTMGFYFLAMALVFCISGGCTFRLFLRRTPPPGENT